MKNTFIHELKWRGMLHDMMPGTEELLDREQVSAYIGFDPTADSLHVGNLVQIMTLLHFQRAGHKPFALVGGATGMVGDPSGKSQERNLLDENALRHNESCIRKQLEKILDFTPGKNAAELVNNYDWFKDFKLLDFVRDVGKHISVNYMMAKDSVKNRLETGMSFTEFTYQLIQGFDFYYLWKNKGIKMQMGGSDQWGNIVTGTELIRRKGAGEAWALTTQLIKKSDGTKFGKTESGNIWLDPAKTSPYAFYQFWLNASDEDAKQYLRIFSIKGKEELDQMIRSHEEAPHLRSLQKAIGAEITERVHSKGDLDSVLEATEILFGKGTTDALKKLDEKTFLSVFEGVPVSVVLKKDLVAGIPMIDFLTISTGIFPSKNEARKMILGGGVSINKEKMENADATISSTFLLNEKYILVQKGKKNYFLVRAE